jgi:hypothetical protein
MWRQVPSSMQKILKGSDADLISGAWNKICRVGWSIHRNPLVKHVGPGAVDLGSMLYFRRFSSIFREKKQCYVIFHKETVFWGENANSLANHNIDVHLLFIKGTLALAAWCCGHRIRQSNRRSWVRIPQGFFRNGLCKLNLHCRCVCNWVKLMSKNICLKKSMK